MRNEDYCEERIARYLELAGAAQEAAGRATQAGLQDTYARLAGQWIELAGMAERTILLARQAARPVAVREVGSQPAQSPPIALSV